MIIFVKVKNGGGENIIIIGTSGGVGSNVVNNGKSGNGIFSGNGLFILQSGGKRKKGSTIIIINGGQNNNNNGWNKRQAQIDDRQLSSPLPTIFHPMLAYGWK